MTIQNELRKLVRLVRLVLPSGALLAATAFTASIPAADTQASFRERLNRLPFKIAYETYTNDNWEIFAMNADGTNPLNLPRTPKEHEHYPQVSPDVTKIFFSFDERESRYT